MNEKLSDATEVYDAAMRQLDTIGYLVGKGVDDAHGGGVEWENMARALFLLEKACKEAKAEISRA